MPASTLQPRVIDEIDENAIDMLDDGLFLEGSTAHGIVACTNTCVSGFTLQCDGSTYARTCVSGRTLRCDG
jgi:Family of unknown function (DUF5973)